METRLASPDDALALAVLHQESFGNACWGLPQIEGGLALANNQAWIAQEGSADLGFILCQFVKDEAEILTFCVAPAARRRGVGTYLLNAALKTARAKNARRLFLEVARDNQAAIALYEKTGFRPIGERPHYYTRGNQTVDALMYSLSL